MILFSLLLAVSAYPGIVYQHAQEEPAHQQEQYDTSAGYEPEPEEGHELQGISSLQNKGYDIGQQHHHVALQGKGYDLSEDHHIDYYVS